MVQRAIFNGPDDLKWIAEYIAAIRNAEREEREQREQREQREINYR